jgi:fatty acid desaturase
MRWRAGRRKSSRFSVAIPSGSVRANASPGEFISRRERARFPIPGRLNLAIALVQLVSAWSLLAIASRAASTATLVLVAIAFAFVMQLGFCLAHEAVHRKLYRQRRVNLWTGVTLFTLFPGSFHFFEVAHLLHHKRNRSNDELEDYVLPGETPWLKRVMYYLLICGLFWLLVPLSSIGIALIPRSRIRLPDFDEDSGAFRRFVQFVNQVRPGRVRRDVLLTIALWSIAIPLLHLRLAPVAICYAAFGFSWASQQYIYHVRTPRHAVLGALDLRVWTPIRWLYLNFNYHLTHHIAVWVPWIHLPAVAEQEPTSGYLETYARLWRPPQTLDQAWPPTYQHSGPLPERTSTSVELPW